MSPYDFWSSTTQESYNTTSTSSSKVSYNLGNCMIPKKPINLVSVPKYTVDFNIRKDSSSSLFSNDIWFSTSSSKSSEFQRRMVPYNRMLPPLELPASHFSESSDDFWTSKGICPSKFSLPPIDLPNKCKKKRCKMTKEITSDDSAKVRDIGKEKLQVRVSGVKKKRTRIKLSGVRRMVTCLMQRSIRGKCF